MADQSRCDFHVHGFILGALQFPGLGIRFGCEAQRCMLGELLGPLGPPGAVQVVPGGNEQFAGLTEAAHDQAILTAGSRSHPQRQIEAFVEDIHAPIAGMNDEPDGGVAAKEFR